MKHIFIFCFFSLVFFSGYSQKKSIDFPENALGIYKGTLVINSSKGEQEIPMEFHLKKTDSAHKFNYVLMYNNSPRNYTLIVKDKSKGIYEVDENNGIILPTRFANNTLYSFFEVQGNFLSSRISFSENELDFEILFSAKKNKITTGGISKDIPEVFGFPISVVQSATLKKE
ncbi:hypothetical protein [uncultured Polaribacter sp.]|uniref:hypothetical protein n=1 Tax=uncultured Polaribacter sp. TaxID=174711 RepID=UPI0026297627|nr:hypothetical protein [uncultured Polaribacter sp.]